MSLSELLPVVTVHLYALGTIAIVSGILSRTDWLKKLALWLFSLGIVAQTILIIILWGTNFPTLTQPIYVLMLSWLLIFITLIIWVYMKYESLLLPLTPLSLCVFLFALLLRHAKTPLPPELSGIVFSIHIGAIFLSLSLAAIGFGAGILFLLQEHTIKNKTPIVGFRKDIPALSVLDKVNALTVMLGFPLFSIGIIFGCISARLAWGSLFFFDPKEIISIIVWGLYAWLFYQRFTLGWQGRKPAILTVWIFIICVFSLVVVNFFTKTYHNFLS